MCPAKTGSEVGKYANNPSQLSNQIKLSVNIDTVINLIVNFLFFKKCDLVPDMSEKFHSPKKCSHIFILVFLIIRISTENDAAHRCCRELTTEKWSLSGRVSLRIWKLQSLSCAPNFQVRVLVRMNLLYRSS